MSLAKFGVFEFDLRTLELRKQGRLVRVGHQPASALALLVTRAGDLVTREELRQAIWGDDTFVDFDSGLSACINQVRTALGDRAASPRFIETLPKRGYRFLAEVAIVGSAAAGEASAAGPELDAVVPDAGPLIAPRRTAPLPHGRWFLAAGLILTAISLGVHWMARASTPARPIVIAVLPAETEAAGLEEAAAMITETIIGRLAAAAPSTARVLSRLHSAEASRAPRPIEALEALGTDYFVDVTIHPLGDLVRVHAKLAHHSGWIMLVRDRDIAPAELSRLAAVMGEVIAADVAREIVAPPGHAASRRLTREAAEALATARTQQSRGELEASLLSYQSATSLAPDSPAAWTGLGEALLRAVRAGWVDTSEGLSRAREASRRALTIEPDFPDAIELASHLSRLRTNR